MASNGSDSNSGAVSSPWLTLHHADAQGPQAGDCINVAPGTYGGVELAHGGSSAHVNGYVVYRCSTMDGCTVNGNAGVHNAESFETVQNTNGTPPNYLIFDGFTMTGDNSSSGVGVSVWNGNNSASLASHHIWVLNSVISDFGQSGIGVAASEYYYLIHNTIFDNSNTQCSSQGSGIAINIMHTVPNYTPTLDDMTNPNPLLGPTWVNGSSFFHNVVEWNVVYNNGLTQCGTSNNPYDTDGNGIIFDSNLTANGDTENYPGLSLAAFQFNLQQRRRWTAFVHLSAYHSRK